MLAAITKTNTRIWVTGLLCLSLVACGGGTSTSASTSTADHANTNGVVFEEASGAPPAWLNAKSLEDAERQAKATSTPLDKLAPGQIAAWDDYANGNVARKSTALRIPVYRFYNTQTTAHFYTTSEAEKANILATMPQFSLDGAAFEAASDTAPGLSPVYRFFNTQTGVHFYTISETEKNSILATMPQFQLEGTAYYASQVRVLGAFTALYRFYMPSKGFHFYTASITERETIQATLSNIYTYEGPAYYVPFNTWTSDKLPHTGIGTDQCYGRNVLSATDVFGTCGLTFPVVVSNLYKQQDSARANHNPMGYEPVLIYSAHSVFPAPITNCVRDTVTGKFWEGKTDDGGLRDKDNTYTNLGNGAANDTSGYIAAVNAQWLCGFHTWRLPTALELITLNHYGRNDQAPFVDPTWFPNAVANYHWTSEQKSATEAWAVTNAGARWEGYAAKASALPVRLVFGGFEGDRYTYTSIAYGSDGANNVVNDHLTGLQWRRCVEGQTWTGSACTGSASTYTHRNALTYANAAGLVDSGWRIPNVKELASLSEKSAAATNFVDASAFPGAPPLKLWSTTAYVWGSSPLSYAYAMDPQVGTLASGARSDAMGIRLVR